MTIRQETTRSWPHPLVSVGALMGIAIATAPGSLPRDAMIAAVLVAAFGVSGALIGALAGRLWPCRNRSRRITTAVCGLFSLGLVAQMVWWQSRLHDAVGRQGVDLSWVLTALTPIAAVIAVCAVGRRVRIAGAVVAAAVALTVLSSPTGAAGPPESVSQKFVSAGAVPGSLRVYGELDDRDVSVRARATVERWQAAGGMDRDAVVVAVPTGSGWVDPDAMVGFERRLGGNVSVIAVQYSDIPSWRAFVTSSEPARSNAVAVVSALIDAIDIEPDSSRPQIYLFGQSLGAIGADAARQWVAHHHPGALCHTVLAGAPAGSATLAAPDTTVFANGSDPVVRWSPTLLWQPPRVPPTLSSDLPRAPWFPIASFVQTSADLIGALSFPAGHGHQYGTEQGLLVPRCPR